VEKSQKERTVLHQMSSDKTLKKYVVTHSGWFLLCPVWLADFDKPDIVPIPKGRMWWLFDLMTALQQGLNFIIGLFKPDSCGFVFHRVQEVPKFEMDV